MDISQQTSAAHLRIWLLGAFRVNVGSHIIDEGQWKLRKAQNLIKLLALAPHHRLHREQLIDLLWPDSSFRSNSNSLHQALYVLRRVLNPAGAHASRYLAWYGDLLVLCPNDQLWIDVEAFEAAAQEARRSQEPSVFQSALELYCGELLPEDLYADWASARRETLRQQYLSLLGGLAAIYEAHRQYSLAIGPLKRLLAAEPAHEDTHRSLMRQYALSGDRAQALRQYHLLRDALRTELDAEPDAASRRLYDQILAGHFQASEPPARAQLNNLPLPATSFIGRESDIAEVERLMQSTRLLTLTGPGGCGKTRLALKVASALVDEFADGVWLVELAALTDPALVPQAVATALGLFDLSAQPSAELITRYLRSKQLLLVLDNCEHVLDGCVALASALLQASASLRLLATSRESLRVAGELSWRLPSLSLPDPTKPSRAQELLQSEAVRLFVDRARAVAPGFGVTESSAMALTQLCRRLDGIPLAIELAAARMQSLSVEQIAERLEDRLGLLGRASRTAPTRQQTLRATIDWSYMLLSPQERTLFERLSVFAGGWTLEAAEAVGAPNNLASHDVLDVLSELVDKSCVVIERRNEVQAVRYIMLESMRQYAAEKLAQRGERLATQRQHARYMLAFTAEAEPHINGAERDGWLDSLEREHDNLRAAFAWLIAAGEIEPALSLIGNLYNYWDRRGHLGEGLQWAQQVLPMSSTLAPTLARANALLSTGKIHWILNDQVPARAALVESAMLLRRLGAKQSLARALMHLGYTYWLPSDMPMRRRLEEEGLALFRAVGDAYGVSELLMSRGNTARHAGDFASALAFYEQSRRSFQQLGDQWGGAAVLRNLGRLAMDQGNIDAASCYLQQSLDSFRAQRIRLDVAWTLRELGWALQQRGELERAIGCYQEGLTLSSDLALMRTAVGCLLGLVEIATARGQWIQAAKLCAAVGVICETDHVVQELEYSPRLVSIRTKVGAELDKAALAMAWAEGRAMSMEKAVQEARLL